MTVFTNQSERQEIIQEENKNSQANGCNGIRCVTPYKYIWSYKDVKRFAGIYNQRLLKSATQTRREKAAFFNYILDNWEKLQDVGTVRVNSAEAEQWYSNREDSIFAKEYEGNTESINAEVAIGVS